MRKKWGPASKPLGGCGQDPNFLVTSLVGHVYPDLITVSRDRLRQLLVTGLVGYAYGLGGCGLAAEEEQGQNC